MQVLVAVILSEFNMKLGQLLSKTLNVIRTISSQGTHICNTQISYFLPIHHTTIAYCKYVLVKKALLNASHGPKNPK
jgi:hypothetical protein